MRALLEERLMLRYGTQLAGRVAARLEGTLATIPPLGELDRAARALWLRRWTRRLRLDRRSDAFVAARALATDLSGLLVSQRQTRLDVRDSIEDDDFLARQMTLLTSGLANCELMAVLLAAGLRSLGQQATVWSTGDEAAHRGAHTLVHLQSPAGSALVDAWSDVRVMHVPGVRSAAVGPDRAPPGVPDRSSLTGLTIEGSGVYPASAYRAGHAKRIDGSRPKPLRALRDLWRRSPAAAPVWRAYAALRLQHLWDGLADPAGAYARFAERPGLPDPLRLMATKLAAAR